MNILVLSDLHIGKGDRFDTFGWNEDEFISLLERIRLFMNVEKIILNGDVFELMKYKKEEVYQAYPKIRQYFNKDFFVYLKGNHDIINNEGSLIYQIKNSSGKLIHIEHGHNADLLNGTKIGRLLGSIGFRFLKLLTKNEKMLEIYYKIVEFDDHINRIPRKYDSVKYLHYALKLLRQSDLVVFGHTHKIEAHKTYYLNSKKKYLNCGSCSLGRFQAVVIDTETLKYETIKLNKKSKIASFINELEGDVRIRNNYTIINEKSETLLN